MYPHFLEPRCTSCCINQGLCVNSIDWRTTVRVGYNHYIWIDLSLWGSVVGHAKRDNMRDKMRQNPLTPSFGEWLKKRRKQLDLTQAQLGRAVGCSAAAVRKIEAGERRPSRQLAEIFLKVLLVPPAEQDGLLQLARGTLAGTPLFVTLPDLPSSSAGLIGNLPIPLTSLVGRTAEADVVRRMLLNPDVRWVTLLGPPGIGKTRLAIFSAESLSRDFPDGLWFIDLGSLSSPDLVLPSLTRTLAPLDVPHSAGPAELAASLRDRKILLVMDNFEHLAGAAMEIATLLKACRGIKVLATSRTPLQIYGEFVYSVPALDFPVLVKGEIPDNLDNYTAVQLLISRLGLHHPSSSYEVNSLESFGHICEMTQGIPLAIELAAAGLNKTSMEELLNLLEDGHDHAWLRHMSMPALDLPTRQHTLENLVDWSYSLLTADQKKLFCRLSVFSGWFDQEAVEGICIPDGEIIPMSASRLVDGLANASLLEQGKVNGKSCWRMLDFIRIFAHTKLAPREADALKRRRGEYFVAALKASSAESMHARREEIYRMYAVDLIDSMRWALQAKQPSLAWQLADQLRDLWSVRGFIKEGSDALQDLLAIPGGITAEERPGWLEEASDLAWQQHDFTKSLSLAREAVETGRNNNLRKEYPSYLNRLGRILLEQGEITEARRALGECLSLARQDPQVMNPGVPLAQLGEADLFEGCLESADAKCREALSLLTSYEKIFTVMAQTDLAETAIARRDTAMAYHWLVQAGVLAGIHVRRLLVYLCAGAGYLLVSGWDNSKQDTAAAAIYGAIKGLSARTGVPLGPFYRRSILQGTTLLRQRLQPEAWKIAWDVGYHWDRDTALGKARDIIRDSKPNGQ